MVIGVFTRNGGIMLTFIFPHGLRLNAGVYIKCYDKVALAKWREWILYDPIFENMTLHHATQTETSVCN